jgi:hypothetical protein
MPQAFLPSALIFARRARLAEVVRDLHRVVRVKRFALLLVPLVGCSALPGSGRAVTASPAAAHQHHAHAATTGHDHVRTARPAAAKRATPAARVRSSAEQLASLPLSFEPAAEGSDLFVGRAARYVVRVAPTWAEVRPIAAGESSTVTMRFDGAEAGSRTVSATPTPARVDYFRGRDTQSWRTSVPTYSKVTFERVYPGIDIAYYGTNREIEYDILVAPGADPGRVALRFDGASSVEVTKDGDLAIATGHDTLTVRAPVAYQEARGARTAVPVRYEPSGPTSVRLVVGGYDTTQPLVIDPILSYAALLGGTGLDEAVSVAVDAAGYVYLAGTTSSANFPGAPGASRGLDVFVAKLDSRGRLLYSAYVGGAGVDEARGLAIDADGNAYVAGATASADFPTQSARQTQLGGETDAFVFKLSTTGGGLLFSTYHGGAGADEATGVAVDGGRNVAIGGHTRSTNLPVASARQSALLGPLDGFVARFTPAGNAFRYSTYMGGSGTDVINAVGMDPAGNLTATGSSTSADYPWVFSFFTSNQGLTDVVVSQFNPGGGLTFSTAWGGNDVDVAQAVVVDGVGTAYITGTTASPNFPMVSPIQATLGGRLDAFILIIRAGTVPLSTYYGGTRSERGRAVALNAAGRLVVVGQTMSSNLPVGRAAQATTGGNRDTFVVQLNPPYSAAAVAYSTYLGGSNNDEGMGAAIDSLGRVFVTGASSYPFPVVQGASDAFVYGLSTAAGAGVDNDGDGLDDDWETQYFDDLASGASDDPDGDGVSNSQEFANHTHPNGFYTRYLAEGATGQFFDDRIALFNPTNLLARVLIRYQRPGGEVELQQSVSMQPQSRLTVNPEIIPGLEIASVATAVESDQPVIVDRTMTWDSSGFGSHAETSSEQASREWYLAEGATGGGFDLYYLLQNPSGAPATATITYLLPNGAGPIVRQYAVAARTRLTINVDNECFVALVNNRCPTGGRWLADTDVSAKIASDVPILVERAMYLTSNGRTFNAGHDAAGVTAPATSWFLAEGATGAYFDMFILLANPTNTATTVEITYLLTDGAPIVHTYDLLANSRRTVYVDNEPGLANVATSAIVRSTTAVPIVVERAMWWPDGNWIEAHDSAGATVTSSRWALAEGEVGGTRSWLTYVLLANTSATDGQVKVSVFYEDQGPSQVATYTVPARSRFNVDMAGNFPLTEGRRFSVLIEGQGATPPQLVVERAMYSNAGSTVWAAGTNALATPLFADNTFTVTANGVYPKVLVVDEGSRIQITNLDPNSPPTDDCEFGGHDLSDDPHPGHGESPEFHGGVLAFGESRLTSNLVTIGTFGVHDHCHGMDPRWLAKVIVRATQ